MATAPQNPSEQKKKNWFARHKILTGILGVFLFIILISSLGSDDTSDSNTQTQNTTNNVPAVKTITIPSLVEYDDDITSEDIAQDIDLEDVTIPSNYTVISAGNTNITNPVGSEALVSETIDGDTVRLSDGNKVRILGIDTPETKDPRKPVQCFGKEASAKMKELVEGKKVILLVDASQGDKDKYGRLLRYVYSGNTDIGAQMVKEGYAYAYTKYPVAKMEEYKALENEARENNRGLWLITRAMGQLNFLPRHHPQRHNHLAQTPVQLLRKPTHQPQQPRRQQPTRAPRQLNQPPPIRVTAQKLAVPCRLVKKHIINWIPVGVASEIMTAMECRVKLYVRVDNKGRYLTKKTNMTRLEVKINTVI